MQVQEAGVLRSGQLSIATLSYYFRREKKEKKKTNSGTADVVTSNKIASAQVQEKELLMKRKPARPKCHTMTRPVGSSVEDECH